jgi:hypothetical protein
MVVANGLSRRIIARIIKGREALETRVLIGRLEDSYICIISASSLIYVSCVAPTSQNTLQHDTSSIAPITSHLKTAFPFPRSDGFHPPSVQLAYLVSDLVQRVHPPSSATPVLASPTAAVSGVCKSQENVNHKKYEFFNLIPPLL